MLLCCGNTAQASRRLQRQQRQAAASGSGVRQRRHLQASLAPHLAAARGPHHQLRKLHAAAGLPVPPRGRSPIAPPPGCVPGAASVSGCELVVSKVLQHKEEYHRCTLHAAMALACVACWAGSHHRAASVAPIIGIDSKQPICQLARRRGQRRRDEHDNLQSGAPGPAAGAGWLTIDDAAAARRSAEPHSQRQQPGM